MAERSSSLVVIPGVELAEVGMAWQASTGPLVITRDDLAAAVAALDDPAVHSPVLKFAVNRGGHQSPPALAFGRLSNLRLTNDGMTLVGDIVGAPAWLAEVLPYAWPFRSIEGTQNDVTATGAKHLFRVTALALLGVELPAIETLDDVETLFTAATMTEAHVTLTAEVAAARGGAMPNPVTASVAESNVVRAWYEQLGPGRDYWWVREVLVDPLALIVDDDDGSLWEVPVTIAGTEITFGEPVRVRIEYVAQPAVAASSAGPNNRRAIFFANRDESRGGLTVPDLSALRERLGLAADVSDDDVLAAAMDRLPDSADAPTTASPSGDGTGTGGTTGTATAPTPPATGTPAPEPALVAASAVPPGMALISQANLDELRRGAEAGIAASRTLAQQAEDRFIAANRNRIGPVNNPHAAAVEAHLRSQYRANPGEAERVAATLHPVVHTVAAGHDDPGPDGESVNGPWSEAELRAFPELRNTAGKGA